MASDDLKAKIAEALVPASDDVCDVCWKRVATDDEWSDIPEGEGAHLCWGEHGDLHFADVRQRQADAVLAVVQTELDRLTHITTLEREGNEIVEAERDEALAEVARLRVATEALRDEWAEAVEPDGSTSIAPVRGMSRLLDAALRTPDGGSDE